jgi:hypothetical protein
MTRQETFIAQLETLLEQYELLKARSKHDDLSDLPEESARLGLRLQALFDRITRPSDTYGRQAESLRSAPPHIKVVQLSFLAYALVDDLKDGWADSFAELIRADTSAEMMDVADDLSDGGYKDAAAVVAGTALELQLRALANLGGIAVEDAKGKPRRADQIRQDLHSGRVTSKPQDRHVAYWLSLRNAAAHGDYAEYGAAEIKDMLDHVRAFIQSMPA